MQTEFLSNSDDLVPRLEYCSDAKEAPECTFLRGFPFTIGRVKSVDLQVRSKRVSREHAVILREQDRFRVRDLGSTNGTFLNGQPIDAEWLSDGDILTIADTEFTFVSGDDRHSASAATQVIPEREEPVQESLQDLVFDIRKLQETLSCGIVEIGLRPIVKLEDDAIFGWSMVMPTGEGETFSFRPGGVLCESRSRIAGRLRQLARLTAAKDFAQRELVGGFFVRVEPVELQDLESLLVHFSRLKDELHASASPIALLSVSPTLPTAEVLNLRKALDKLGCLLALESKVADCKQMLEFAEARPAHAILVASVFRQVTRHDAGKRQLAAAIEGLRDLGCTPIADAALDDEDWTTIRDLGFRLAFRNKESQDASGPLTAQIQECRLHDVPDDSAQSTRAEIAKVTARIRASWSN